MKRMFVVVTCVLLFIPMAPLLCKKSLYKDAQAPNFTLQDEQGHSVSLSSFRGKRVALMFYPSIKTTRCKREVCNVANDFRQLEEHNIIVLGVSYNSPERNRKFSEKHHVSFPLLYDKHKKVTKAYGVSGWMFPSRKTFLINEQGVIIKVIDDVKVDHHTTQITNGFLS